MQAEDRPGVLADVTRILAEYQISIEAIVQKEPVNGARHVSVIILTQRVLERHMDQATAAIQKLTAILGDVTRIRLEHLAR